MAWIARVVPSGEERAQHVDRPRNMLRSSSRRRTIYGRRCQKVACGDPHLKPLSVVANGCIRKTPVGKYTVRHVLRDFARKSISKRKV